MTDHEAKAREIIQAGYCRTCKRLCGGHVICGTDEYPCDHPVWEPLRDNDELFVSAIATALREAEERATLAEREACKAIADHQVEYYNGQYMVALDAGRDERIDRFYNYRDAAEFIATAIRGRNSTDE